MDMGAWRAEEKSAEECLSLSLPASHLPTCSAVFDSLCLQAYGDLVYLEGNLGKQVSSNADSIPTKGLLIADGMSQPMVVGGDIKRICPNVFRLVLFWGSNGSMGQMSCANPPCRSSSSWIHSKAMSRERKLTDRSII